METRNIPRELKHHGIKGMKWGERRYQNPDGSLTPEGKKRYAQQQKDGRAALKEKQAARKLTVQKAKAQMKKERLDAENHRKIAMLKAKAEIAKAKRAEKDAAKKAAQEAKTAVKKEATYELPKEYEEVAKSGRPGAGAAIAALGVVGTVAGVYALSGTKAGRRAKEAVAKVLNKVKTKKGAEAVSDIVDAAADKKTQKAKDKIVKLKRKSAKLDKKALKLKKKAGVVDAAKKADDVAKDAAKKTDDVARTIERTIGEIDKDGNVTLTTKKVKIDTPQFDPDKGDSLVVTGTSRTGAKIKDAVSRKDLKVDPDDLEIVDTKPRVVLDSDGKRAYDKDGKLLFDLDKLPDVEPSPNASVKVGDVKSKRNPIERVKDAVQNLGRRIKKADVDIDGETPTRQPIKIDQVDLESSKDRTAPILPNGKADKVGDSNSKRNPIERVKDSVQNLIRRRKKSDVGIDDIDDADESVERGKSLVSKLFGKKKGNVEKTDIPQIQIDLNNSKAQKAPTRPKGKADDVAEAAARASRKASTTSTAPLKVDANVEVSDDFKIKIDDASAVKGARKINEAVSTTAKATSKAPSNIASVRKTYTRKTMSDSENITKIGKGERSRLRSVLGNNEARSREMRSAIDKALAIRENQLASGNRTEVNVTPSFKSARKPNVGEGPAYKTTTYKKASNLLTKFREQGINITLTSAERADPAVLAALESRYSRLVKSKK